MTRVRWIAVAVVLVALSPPAGAQEIGRLFHSVEQRSALDSLRKAKHQPQKPPASQSPALPPARLDGYVLRPDGKSMVWVNGQIHVRR